MMTAEEAEEPVVTRRKAGSVRIILIDPAAPRFDKLRTVLAMRPLRKQSDLPALAPVMDPILSWGALIVDEPRTLMARTHWGAGDGSAAADAESVLGRVSDARVVYVGDEQTGRLSWWLADDDQVLLAPVRHWPPTQVRAVVANVKHVISVLGSTIDLTGIATSSDEE